MPLNGNKVCAYGKLLQNPSVARADGINRRDTLLPVFDLVPQILIDDAQFRHLLYDPFGFEIEPPNTPTGIRVLYIGKAVPDELANIKFVIKNPCAAPPVAIDRGRPPGFTRRAGVIYDVRTGKAKFT